MTDTRDNIENVGYNRPLPSESTREPTKEEGFLEMAIKDISLSPKEHVNLRKKTSPEFIGEVPDPNQRVTVEPKHYTTYALEKVTEYMATEDLAVEDLFDHFREDFAEWNENHWQAVDGKVRSEMKKILTRRGVWCDTNPSFVTRFMTILSAPEYIERPAEKHSTVRFNPPCTLR